MEARMSDAPRTQRRTPEWSFQSWVDRLLDRIVVPPMFTTGIDHASQTTDNARARMAGRGIRFGLPDVFVAQSWGRCGWLELKRGSRLSAAQEGVHRALRAAGQKVAVCDTMAGVVVALRDFGFVLRANADNLAVEYEARCVAAERAPAKPRAPGKPRARKPSQSRIRAAHASGIWSP
jgi:hypothetical protein